MPPGVRTFMSAQVWLGAMVAASVLVVATSRRSEPEPEKPIPRAPLERPWLTPDAAAQIIGADGSLGPLFEGVELGGPAPSPTVRARIAAFASAHNVSIDLEVAEGTLTAVRFDVTFGGCCGYEGADVLARRLGRPRLGGGCMGTEPYWVDDWGIAGEDGIHVRARVRVNRVMVRWERQLGVVELLERADRLLGANAVEVARDAGDRWIEIEANRRYRLETPYPIDPLRRWHPDDMGIQVVVASGRIIELSFSVHDEDGHSTRRLRKHWGRPKIIDEMRTWRTSDRIMIADRDSPVPKITIRMR
jgi:hypothetical protein